ncbi:MAG: prepilin-type N-terminal cleavage/methylation domain-containing protein [Planctomycetes bacterium]|nr:prepilin-type N-terminal cleavage/methylation domain-containing protein [Planctomycetota bacterium]
MSSSSDRRRRSGFTLLELLLVIAILAIVSGTLIVAYDGLETKSAQGQATYNIAAVDSAIRTHRVVNKGLFADEWDSLLFVDNAATPTSWNRINLMPAKLRGKLGPHTLTADGVKALSAAGITKLRYLDGAKGYNNADRPAGTDPAIPNRAFDNPTRGWGATVTLAAGVQVAVVEAEGIANFNGSTPTNSSRLRDTAGLDDSIRHIVVAVGLGNNCTMVKSEERRSAGLSEAPVYKNVLPHEYGRFIALFHVASDNGAKGGTADNGTLEPGEYFGTARFIAAIDTKGDWYDEEGAEYEGQKE